MPVPTLVSDFTGTDENPLSEGGNWAILNSSGTAMKRISSAASGNGASSFSYWTPANFGPDLEAYVTITTIGTDVGIMARIQGEGGAGTFDGYRVRATPTGSSISVVTDASVTNLKSGAVTWASGDKLGMKIAGSEISAWRLPSGSSEWYMVCNVTDATYGSAGKIGLNAGDTTARLDDFYAATDSNLLSNSVPTLVSSFTGSDENPLSEGGNWANLNTSGNPLQRISNTAGGPSTGNYSSYWTPANFGPDLEAYVTLSAISTGASGIFFRIQGEGGAATWDGYAVEVTTTATNINRYTNAAGTSLLSVAAVSWASGDKLGVRMVGSTIQAWRQASGSVDWNRVSTVVDTTYSSAGKIALKTNAGVARLDDFYAGTDTDMFGPNAPVYYITA